MGLNNNLMTIEALKSSKVQPKSFNNCELCDIIPTVKRGDLDHFFEPFEYFMLYAQIDINLCLYFQNEYMCRIQSSNFYWRIPQQLYYI